jgi:hypothetical protein
LRSPNSSPVIGCDSKVNNDSEGGVDNETLFPMRAFDLTGVRRATLQR